MGRLTRSRLELDPGERSLVSAEKASGGRPAGCPWRSLSDPFVIDVVRAHRWWKSGQLATKYPAGVPDEILWGVEEFDMARDSVTATDRRLDDEERERRQQAQQSKQPGAVPPRPRRR